MYLEVKKNLFELGLDVTERTNAMLAYWDKDLICRFANNAYLEWFGVKPETVINKLHIRDFLGFSLYEKNLSHINEALKGNVQTFEREVPFPSGQTKKARITYFPNFVNGQVNGFYVHIADISPDTITQIDTSSGFENAQSYLASNDQILEDVVQTLKSCILTPFPGIASLAKKHFISSSKLKRDFKIKYKSTIFSFYRNTQMELAYKYITEKKCCKNQMAMMLNFSNPSNFSVCYNKYVKQRERKELRKEIELEHNERYKTFIEQAPIALAMLDNDMLFMAVSHKWISDYGLQNKELTGKSIYEIFPDTELVNSEMFKTCLQGNINHCDEALIKKEDGTSAWMRWDVRPWYKRHKEIGGLLIFTEDITASKLRDEETGLIAEILHKSSEISRTGAWSSDFKSNKIIWSKIAKEIFEVDDNFKPDMATGLNFYKKGTSRRLVKKVLHDAVEKGYAFDIEAQIFTALSNCKQIRIIGYPEFYNGKCEKISGIFQDITNQKFQ